MFINFVESPLSVDAKIAAAIAAFAATLKTAVQFISGSFAGVAVGAKAQYYYLGSSNTATTTFNREARTLQALGVYVSSNASLTDITLTLVVDGVDTGCRVVIPAGNTGLFTFAGTPFALPAAKTFFVRGDSTNGGTGTCFLGFEWEFTIIP